MTIWVAEYELGAFQMRGYGATRMDASGALVRAVAAHVQQTGADPDHITWAMEAEPAEITLGVGYRDGTPCGLHAALDDYSAVTDRKFNRATGNSSLYG